MRLSVHHDTVATSADLGSGLRTGQWMRRWLRRRDRYRTKDEAVLDSPLAVEMITHLPAHHRPRNEETCSETTGRYYASISGNFDVYLTEVEPLLGEGKPCLIYGFLRAKQQPVPMNVRIRFSEQLQVPLLSRQRNEIQDAVRERTMRLGVYAERRQVTGTC